MFLAVGDESGNHSNEQHPFMAVAGYLAEIATWQAFNKQWSRQLADFGLETFHMTEFFRRKTSPYRDWSDQTCEYRIIRLIEVLNTYNLRGFAVQVSRDEELPSRKGQRRLTRTSLADAPRGIHLMHREYPVSAPRWAFGPAQWKPNGGMPARAPEITLPAITG